jgi:hypothetical protein
MPYFPDLNALFIHIPKNAGRSIENALFPDGVVSTSGKRSKPNRLAHYLQTVTANKTVADYLVGTRDVSLSAQHLTLVEIEMMGLAPSPAGKRPFTFCVVRNPYERAISSVLHFRKRFADLYTLDAKPTAEQVETALEAWAVLVPANQNHRAHRRPQADFVFNRTSPNAMDRVLRFETLAQDFARVTEALGVPDVTLPWVGKSSTEHKDYAALFTPRARTIVETLYAADLELFDYDFPN